MRSNCFIFAVPAEIIEVIIGYCGRHAPGIFSLVSKRFNAIINNNTSFKMIIKLGMIKSVFKHTASVLTREYGNEVTVSVEAALLIGTWDVCLSFWEYQAYNTFILAALDINHMRHRLANRSFGTLADGLCLARMFEAMVVVHNLYPEMVSHPSIQAAFNFIREIFKTFFHHTPPFYPKPHLYFQHGT